VRGSNASDHFVGCSLLPYLSNVLNASSSLRDCSSKLRRSQVRGFPLRKMLSVSVQNGDLSMSFTGASNPDDLDATCRPTKTSLENGYESSET
jgi:hypothetical protein